MPLNFNCKPFFRNNKEKNKIKQKKTTENIIKYIKSQKYSPYRYTKDEIFNAANNPVINHFYPDKLYNGFKCNIFIIQWINYAKLTGLYKIIKKKYPIPFKKCEYLMKRKKNYI